MSTEARHASIPPRPTTPPRPTAPPKPGPEATDREEPVPTPDTTEERPAAQAPGTQPTGGAPTPTTAVPPMPGSRPGEQQGAREVPSRHGGTAEPTRDASLDTPPRFPRLRAPSSGDAAPLTPPPPKASARFPDTPPPTGQDTRGTTTPPRPATPPRRNGTPPETAFETTFRLRPVPVDTDRDPSLSRPTSPDAPPRPGTRPSSGPASTAPSAAPPRPGTRPISASGPAASSDAPPRPGTRPTSAPGPAASSGAPAGVPPRPGSRPAATSADAFGGSAPFGDASMPGPRSASAPADIPGGHPSPRQPDPSLSWSAPLAPGDTPGSGRPVVSFGQPEGYDEQARPRVLGGRGRLRAVGVAVCLVLGLGLIGGAATGSWLVGDSAAAGSGSSFAAAAEMWHSVPVDQLFPPTVQGQGAGPGGADRTWTRIAVAPDSGCKDAFDPLLRKALAPVGCQRLLRATYTDATQSYVTTVGLLFTKADAAGMTALDTRFGKEKLGDRTDLMPRTYAAENTAAAGFGTKQRASWAVSVLTDAPVVAYAVSGWADGRTVDEPEPAGKATASGATTDIAQAGLGHEAQGLVDRIERGFRKTVASATEKPS
ncbi:hypothetical protein [Streptomyces sp. NPDC001536]|uniref:hypothetical protein n=1 Tax=Streptomyces sp. NPDC001536 TaxID=3364583 RepID=UPI0036C44CB3